MTEDSSPAFPAHEASRGIYLHASTFKQDIAATEKEPSLKFFGGQFLFRLTLKGKIENRH
jgi:hypothetical protein